MDNRIFGPEGDVSVNKPTLSAFEQIMFVNEPQRGVILGKFLSNIDDKNRELRAKLYKAIEFTCFWQLCDKFSHILSKASFEVDIEIFQELRNKFIVEVTSIPGIRFLLEEMDMLNSALDKTFSFQSSDRVDLIQKNTAEDLKSL